MNTKICTMCKQEKSLLEFIPRKRGGFLSYCKKCNSQYRMERWKSLKHKAVMLLGGKCHTCGYDRNLAALDFHHLDPSEKEGNWSKLKKRSWDRLVEELKKCVLLCKNCHAEYHCPNLMKSQLADTHVFRVEYDRASFVQCTGKCPLCEKDVFKTKFCSVDCARKSQQRVQRPSCDQLKAELKLMSWSEMGRKYGVSDSAIRKWQGMCTREKRTQS